MTIQLLPASILVTITVIAVLCLIFRWFGLKKVRSFYVWIGVLAVLGGVWAFLFPLAINADFGKDGDGAALRQMLIYTTGGVLGVITLGETHRKNNLEKDKNDKDYDRQVYTERRSRYTTAIEQLSNDDSATTCLGGVYSLVGLVDEWLADVKTIPNIKERRKKGQVIINNLCAYIRSPFPLAERAEQLDKDYAKDLQNDFGGDKEKFDADKRAFTQEKAALEEECQVRQSIIKEICERLQELGAPGLWSEFDYDFSNAHFFYPIVFTNSYFGASSKFTGAVFTQDAKFIGVTFNIADFSMTKFAQNVDFSKAIFTGEANFSKAIFTGEANFSKGKFTLNASFSRAKFTRRADFYGATFTRDVYFSRAKFIRRASFSRVTFTKVNFFGVTFTQDASFSGATFTQDADFSWTTFQTRPIFESTLGNKARFSRKANPEDYNFEVSPDSTCIIETEEQEYNGIKFVIPKGTILFDPEPIFIRNTIINTTNTIFFPGAK